MGRRLAEDGAAPALLYGGSVDPTNAAATLSIPHVDGLFVGRAAWTAAGFVELLQLAAHAACAHVQGEGDPHG